MTSDSSAGSSFPILRLFAGLVFVAAGLLFYFQVNLGFSFALLFIAAGAAVVLFGLLGHRARAGDIALFIISLIVLAGVASSYNFATGAEHTYSATKTQVVTSHIAIDATTSFGSITLRFSNNADLAYQVVFGRTIAFPFSIPLVNQSTSFSNFTRGGVFFLKRQLLRHRYHDNAGFRLPRRPECDCRHWKCQYSFHIFGAKIWSRFDFNGNGEHQRAD